MSFKAAFVATRLDIEGNLRVLHYSLIGTFRIERQDIVRHIELLLLLDFVVRVQNLRTNKHMPRSR